MQQFSKDLNFRFLIVSIFSICILVSNISIAAVPTQGQPCPECTNENPPLPVLGGGGLLGLRTMLTAMSFAAVYTDENPLKSFSKIKNSDAPNIPGVGMIEVESGEYGWPASGFLINECLVLTNKHVVEQDGYKTTGVTFRTGEGLTASSTGRIIKTNNIYSKDDPRTYGADWAVIKLDKPLGKTSGFLEPEFSDESTIAKMEDLTVVGLIDENVHERYASEEGITELQYQDQCEAKGIAELASDVLRKIINSGTIMSNCASVPGTSGSVLTKKGTLDLYRSFGIMKNGVSAKRETEFTVRNSNIFVPFLKSSSLPGAFTEATYKEILAKYPCK